jgi:hypothetical protein
VLEVYAFRIEDTANRRLAVIFIDITSRKKTEDTLRENEAQLEAELADSLLLQRISAQLIEQENVEALYETILDAACTAMNANAHLSGATATKVPRRSRTRTATSPKPTGQTNCSMPSTHHSGSRATSRPTSVMGEWSTSDPARLCSLIHA